LAVERNHRTVRDDAGAELRLAAAIDVHPVERARTVTLRNEDDRLAVW
jgi:hypothetical protein